jgi:hypothetical protein
VGTYLEFSIIGDRTRSWTDRVVLQISVQTAATFMAGAWFFSSGLLDQYTLTVMIHGALLITAPQILHLFKFQRRRNHRRLYWINTAIILTAFVLSYYGGYQSSFSENLCPELREAIAMNRNHRAKVTLFGVVLCCFLTAIDIMVAAIDYIRNKFVDRKLGDHSRPTFPKWLLWNPKDQLWNYPRILYCVMAVTWFIFSIVNIEYLLIQDFHEYANHHTDGTITNSENRWAIGQIIAIIIALIWNFSCNRNFIAAKLAPLAAQEKGIPLIELK